MVPVDTAQCSTSPYSFLQAAFPYRLSSLHGFQLCPLVRHRLLPCLLDCGPALAPYEMLIVAQSTICIPMSVFF